jgi:hypothetical protein
VYAYPHDGPRADTPADRSVLMPVAQSQIVEAAAWKYFVSFDENGQPLWSRDVDRRGGVFRHPDACLRSAIVYNAPLERYLCWQHLPRPRGAGGPWRHAI